MDCKAIAQKINSFILESTNIDTIEYDMDIFDEGLVSSLFAIDLMTFLEKNFEIKITTSDLDMNNYKSINSIIKFVCKKKAGDI